MLVRIPTWLWARACLTIRSPREYHHPWAHLYHRVVALPSAEMYSQLERAQIEYQSAIELRHSGVCLLIDHEQRCFCALSS